MKQCLKIALKYLNKNSPVIFEALGIMGMLGTMHFVATATRKTVKQEEEEETERALNKLGGDDEPEPPKHPKLETIKRRWKNYIPAAISFGLSTACIVSGHKTLSKRYALASAGYALSKAAFDEYRNKVIGTIGEEAEKDIRQAIAKDNAITPETSAAKIENKTILISSNVLFKDTVSGKMFYSYPEEVKELINRLNRKMLTETHISKADYMYEFGFFDTTSDDEDVGWNIYKGLLEMTFRYEEDENGKPIFIIDVQKPYATFNMYS